MSHADTPISQLVSLFTREPSWMIEPLALELRYSIPSVRRFLNEVGYYSSFTHNGAWYTLCSIPRFDRDGLWFCRDIGFSRAGSLTKTLIELTTRSLSGMSAEALGEMLRCRCHSILVQLCRRGKLERRKQGRSYVYMATDPEIAAAQRQALAMNSPPSQLPAEIAVLVLAEFIKNPKVGFEQLAKGIAQARGVTVELSQIERLFEAHGVMYPRQSRGLELLAPQRGPGKPFLAVLLIALTSANERLIGIAKKARFRQLSTTRKIGFPELSAYSDRLRPAIRSDCDRDSGVIATGIPVGLRPLFRSIPTG